MKRVLLIIAIALSPAIATAQQVCTELLRNGVFDNTKNTQLYSSYTHVQTIICSSDYEDYATAKKLSVSADIPLGDLLIPFGFQDNENAYKTSRRAFCSQNQNELYLDQKYISSVKTADQGLATAFVNCVKAMAPGFEYYIEAGASPSQFVFRSIYRQGADKVYPRVKSFSVEPRNLKCSAGINRFNKGSTLGLDESFTCTRDPHQEITISLSTTVIAQSGPAVLPKVVDEKVIDDERNFVSAQGYVASLGDTNLPGQPVCLQLPEHYVFLTPHNLDNNIKTDKVYDEITDTPNQPGKEITDDSPRQLCGREITRGARKDTHYAAWWHVEAWAAAHYLQIAPSTAYSRQRVMTVRGFLAVP